MFDLQREVKPSCNLFEPRWGYHTSYFYFEPRNTILKGNFSMSGTVCRLEISSATGTAGVDPWPSITSVWFKTLPD